MPFINGRCNLRSNHNTYAAAGRVRASIARLGLALPVDRYIRYAQSTQQCRYVLRAFFGKPGLLGQPLPVRQQTDSAISEDLHARGGSGLLRIRGCLVDDPGRAEFQIVVVERIENRELLPAGQRLAGLPVLLQGDARKAPLRARPAELLFPAPRVKACCTPG